MPKSQDSRWDWFGTYLRVVVSGGTWRVQMFFDHPKPGKIQGAVAVKQVFSFLRVFRRRSHRRGRPISFYKDTLRALMWRHVAPNWCSILSGSRAGIKRTKTTFSAFSSHLSSYAPGCLEDGMHIRSTQAAHPASAAWWICTSRSAGVVTSRGHVPSQLASPNGHVGWYGTRPLLGTTPALHGVHAHRHAALLFVARPILVYRS